LRLDPSRCWYVGDDERDIVAGRAAGMQTLAATYGYLGVVADWQAWGADDAIDRPQGLLKKLESA
jgi:phosphoglycolate phosphatase-like HAD superfamily hydrolase